MNSLNIVGRLVRDPELRTLSTGKSIAEFTIAVNRRVKAQDGTDADFFRAKAWGQVGEYVNTYLTKGRLVAVTGRLETRKWKDKDGNQRESVEIVADSVTGLDRPKDDNPVAGATTRQQATVEGDEYDPFAEE